MVDLDVAHRILLKFNLILPANHIALYIFTHCLSTPYYLVHVLCHFKDKMELNFNKNIQTPHSTDIIGPKVILKKKHFFSINISNAS